MSDLPPYPDPSGIPATGEFAAPIPAPRPAYPTSDFQMPGGVPGYDITAMGADPLVTPPDEGFSGWWMRLWKTFRRSWVSLLPIVGLASGLPGVVFALLIESALHRMTVQLQAFQVAQQQGDPIPPDIHSSIVTIYGYTGLFLLALVIIGAVGWPAAIWTITKQAAGERAPFGRAIGYGLKESPRTVIWVFLYFLLILGGSICCALPGLYAAVAGSLIVPLVIFSRGSLSESFRMVNRNFGGVLGRVLTLYAASFAVSVISALMGAAAGRVGTVSSGTTTAIQIVGAILSIPATILMIIGITLTFAEMRAREMPTSTELLSQAL